MTFKAGDNVVWRGEVGLVTQIVPKSTYPVKTDLQHQTTFTADGRQFLGCNIELFLVEKEREFEGEDVSITYTTGGETSLIVLAEVRIVTEGTIYTKHALVYEDVPTHLVKRIRNYLNQKLSF